MNKQLANLFTLLGAVQAQPEEAFNLSSYCEKRTCGTLFCTAGLAATLPHFQAQGMALATIPYGTGFMVEVNGDDVDETEDTNELFGDDAWANLFAARGDGSRDYDFDLNYAMTDKQLAVKRIEAQIEAIQKGA